MTSAPPGAIEIARQLARDPWVRIAALIAALGAATEFLPDATGPGLSTWTNLMDAGGLTITLLAIACFTLLRPLPVESRAEQRVWWQVGGAVAAWLIVLSFKLFAGLAPRTAPSASWVQMSGDLGYTVYYALLLLATEERADRRSPLATSPGRSRMLDRTTLIVVVTLAAAYLVILPGISAAALSASASASASAAVSVPVLDPVSAPVSNSAPPLGESSPAPDLSLLFYLLLDLAVFVRFAGLSYDTASPRWRTLYGLAASAAFAVLAVDASAFWSTPAPSVPLPPAVTALASLVTTSLQLTALLLLVSLGAARSLRFPPRTDAEPIQRYPRLAAPARTTLWALQFPLFHVLLYQGDRLGLGLFGRRAADPVLQAPREALVLIAVVALGLLASLQYRQLERRARRLLADQRTQERSLRTSEQDLRLQLEQSQVASALQAEAEKRARIFRLSPYPMTISNIETSEFLEANDRFLELVGLRHDELIGQSAIALGLWDTEPELRAEIIEQLDATHAIEVRNRRFLRPDGQVRIIHLSGSRIDGPNGPRLLMLLIDVSDRAATHEALERDAALFDRFLADENPADEPTAEEPTADENSADEPRVRTP